MLQLAAAINRTNNRKVMVITTPAHCITVTMAAVLLSFAPEDEYRFLTIYWGRRTKCKSGT